MFLHKLGKLFFTPAVSEVNCRFLRRDYLHRDGFFVFGPMELKIGGVTLLRVLNQWFSSISAIFDISMFSGSIMISYVPFSTISWIWRDLTIIKKI